MVDVQDAVGAMLVFTRVFEGSDGSFIYVLDGSRCAATNLRGVAFINDSKRSPRWLLGDEKSLIRRCLGLSFGCGFHYDLSAHYFADGVRAAYMLHAADGVIIQFLNWAAPGAFDGMQADFQRYAEMHVLDSVSKAGAGHTFLCPSSADPNQSFDECEDLGSPRSDTTDSLESLYVSLGKEMLLGKCRKSIDAASSQHLQLGLEQLPDLSPALLQALPAELVVAVLPKALQVLPPIIAKEIVRAVLDALPAAERLPDLVLTGLGGSVPAEHVVAVLPNALKELPPTVATAVMKAVLSAVAAVPAQH